MIWLGFVLCACGEDVAAPSGVDEPFSLFGIINPRLNDQTLMVSPIDPNFADFPDSIDAIVTSTDLETGVHVVWKDSVVVGARGQSDHVFLAGFRPRFGTSYQVEVERSDGAVTSAVANVPEEVDVTYDDLGSQTVYVSIAGGDFHLLSIDVLYTVRPWAVVTDSAAVCRSPGNTYAIPYTGKEGRIDNGYRVAINPTLDHEHVMKLYSADNGISWVPGRNGFALTHVQVRLLVAEEAWDPPGDIFDMNALSHPGTMSNVANGYGFVGGGYNHDAGVYPSEGVIGASWFFDFLMRPPGDCLDYCVCGFQ